MANLADVMKALRRLDPARPELLLNIAYAQDWTDEKLAREAMRHCRSLKAKLAEKKKND